MGSRLEAIGILGLVLLDLTECLVWLWELYIKLSCPSWTIDICLL